MTQGMSYHADAQGQRVASVHFIHRNGQIACGARYPELVAVADLADVTCRDCRVAVAGRSTVSTMNGLATWSLVLAILWGFGFFSLFAVIFGHAALRQIRERRQDGRPIALLGLFLGYLGLALPALLLIGAVVSASG
jgi:hypothetical protein